MADLPRRQQPFRFWLPYWTNSASSNWRSRPSLPHRQRSGCQTLSEPPAQPQTQASSPSASASTKQLKMAERITLSSSPLKSQPGAENDIQSSESQGKLQSSSASTGRNLEPHQPARKMSSRSNSPLPKGSHKNTAPNQVNSQLISQAQPTTTLSKLNIKESSLPNKENSLPDEPHPVIEHMSPTEAVLPPEITNPIPSESKAKNHLNRQQSNSNYVSTDSRGKFLADLDSTSSLKPPQSDKNQHHVKINSENSQITNSEHKSEQGKEEESIMKLEPNEEVNTTELPNTSSSSNKVNKNKSIRMPETQVEEPEIKANNLNEKKETSRLATASKDRLGEVASAFSNRKPEQKQENDKEPTVDGSSGKEHKIMISTIPRASLFYGQRATFQKEIEEGVTKLRQKIEVGNSDQPRNGQALNIITLAGKNKGASMVINYDGLTRKGFPNFRTTNSRDKEKKETTSSIGQEILYRNGKAAIAASVNNNVQNINNSTLHESFCSVRNPGVHMNLSNTTTKPFESNKKKEAPKAERRDSTKVSAQNPVHEPRIRRRCLRALFMESSESEPENPRKPQRHGCRYSCEEKKRKDEIVGTSTTSTSIPHGQGTSRV